MGTAYSDLQSSLRESQSRWLVTGAAGFIGSHLVESLLKLGQIVVGVDNFSTGHKKNLASIKSVLSPSQWDNYTFIEGDIQDASICRDACVDVNYVLHQAALGSVPRSIKDPITSNDVNVGGFLQILTAARDAGVDRFVYASSSSVYGDEPNLPKTEDKTGNLLSPYAVTKAVNESYASVFYGVYGIQTVGLRYFNVFGPRQDPEGAYAAVIPRWVGELLAGKTPQVFGDGETSRDFCYVHNAVQANILAACTDQKKAYGQAFNVSFGGQISLNELYKEIVDGLGQYTKADLPSKPAYADFRAGDVRHSRADISRAKEILGYDPEYSLADGLSEALQWYVENTQQVQDK